MEVKQYSHKTFLSFKTKALTLIDLQTHLRSAKVLPLYYFTVKDWCDNKNDIINGIEQKGWFEQALIVRSSTHLEDQQNHSLAGHFYSAINIKRKNNFINATEKVIASYKKLRNDDQILVQPMLQDIKFSGVVFGADPNTAAPYIIISYDDDSKNTDHVTSGKTNNIKYYYYQWEAQIIPPPREFEKIIVLMKELRNLYGTNKIDVEFCLTKEEQLFVFQVRPLIIKQAPPENLKLEKSIQHIVNRLTATMKPHPYLHGKKTIYGIMPDWNPAEIIGFKPTPLALSLYKDLITDSTWAYQRDNYGYRALRGFPLLIEFAGIPYIDVRVSFNSFLPKKLPRELSEKLINYYIDRLIENPALHDKVEFELVFTSYTFTLRDRLKHLTNYGFSQDEQNTINNALLNLTNRIIHNDFGLWKADLKKINKLKTLQNSLLNSNLDQISKMYWLLEDCKRYGTLPFSGLARAAFIAVEILKSLVQKSIISESDYGNFFNSLNLISTKMQTDLFVLDQTEFLKKYGHLRPGTYDILSPRYDEQPQNIYHNAKPLNKNANGKKFLLSICQLREIQNYCDKEKLSLNALNLLEFIRTIIEAREYAKFIFSKSVSEFLRLLEKFSNQYGITRDECAYLDLQDILSLYTASRDPYMTLIRSIENGRHHYNQAKQILLPPLLITPQDPWAFHVIQMTPNFITQEKVIAPTVEYNNNLTNIENYILFIPSADPGFDWIFSKNIAGFVAKFGGANSLMAIRSSELGI